MGRWLGETGRVGRLWCLSLAAGLLGLLGVAGTAYGRDHSTVVVGYVSAGAPVSGARLAVFNRSGRRLKLRAQGRARQSDADGYFALVLPAATGPVRLVASGGTTGGARVDGSLRAIAVHPGVAHVAFVNPVSTVAAAYRARHPRASVAAPRGGAGAC